ncbi:MAG: ABC transporter ATP-binding protein [Clostridium argentinense]|uniref:ABC transporter ATP-binding protein n=1 Tax=Clostridium faecium TaxID=2762223 RepID=A0ABR8YVI9_9CLOT|nr:MULTISPECIES: ABC transporter ATP-binding protein [Clostridium]MBD8048298.1 ABC transporter ATP-binding protein [Clostridium faecium]MBS5823039.1 ABC transporter ATP-binding protein [Clostridium argentinense]MDU1349199.1 ABC transporter ATP-binding protein [Clostridium argentinense]
MGNWVLETKELTRKFGNQTAVNNINIHVPKGKIYGLLGRNGAGKTTTLRMIMGLIKPTSGEIEVFGQNLLQNKKEIYPRIGSIIENPGFYQNLTGKENLKILAKLRGIHRLDAIEYALSVVGLDKEVKKKVSQYSLGMKQRLGIAAAIMHEPELLILDEPINGLDPIGIQEMRNFLVRLCEESHVTIVISSHILSEIEQLADYIGVIHDGKLLEEVSIQELRKRNRKYLEFQVSNENKATLIIEKYFKITDYEVHEGGNIRIYSHLGEQGKINQAFVENHIEVLKIIMSEDNLEDYFIKLIGGGAIG